MRGAIERGLFGQPTDPCSLTVLGSPFDKKGKQSPFFAVLEPFANSAVSLPFVFDASCRGSKDNVTEVVELGGVGARRRRIVGAVAHQAGHLQPPPPAQATHRRNG